MKTLLFITSALALGFLLGIALNWATIRRRRCKDGERQRKAQEVRERVKTSNLVLTVLGMFLLIFIAVMTVTYWVKGGVPDTLIQYTLGAGGMEALLLAGIKISKVMKGENTDEHED